MQLQQPNPLEKHLASEQSALNDPLRAEPPPTPPQPPDEPTIEKDVVRLQIFQHPHWKQLLTDTQRHAVIRFIYSKLPGAFLLSPIIYTTPAVLWAY